MDDPTWVSLRLLQKDSEEKLIAPMESLYIQGLVTELTSMFFQTTQFCERPRFELLSLSRGTKNINFD